MKPNRPLEEQARRKQAWRTRTAEARAEESAEGKAFEADRRAHPKKYKASPTRVEWEGHQLVTRQKAGGQWRRVSTL